MGNGKDMRELFKIPKSTAQAMQENLDKLEILSEVQTNLQAVGLVDPKTVQQLEDLKTLTKSILKNFDVES